MHIYVQFVIRFSFMRPTLLFYVYSDYESSATKELTSCLHWSIVQECSTHNYRAWYKSTERIFGDVKTPLLQMVNNVNIPVQSNIWWHTFISCCVLSRTTHRLCEEPCRIPSCPENMKSAGWAIVNISQSWLQYHHPPPYGLWDSVLDQLKKSPICLLFVLYCLATLEHTTC